MQKSKQQNKKPKLCLLFLLLFQRVTVRVGTDPLSKNLRAKGKDPLPEWEGCRSQSWHGGEVWLLQPLRWAQPRLAGCLIWGWG